MELENLFLKLNIKLVDEDGVFKTFPSVIMELANVWEALNDDYKEKLYKAMGIAPGKPRPMGLGSPNNLRDVKLPFKYPRDNVEPFTITYDNGIEYLQNQPTCASEGE